MTPVTLDLKVNEIRFVGGDESQVEVSANHFFQSTQVTFNVPVNTPLKVGDELTVLINRKSDL
jgi:hypothetical protein